MSNRIRRRIDIGHYQTRLFDLVDSFSVNVWFSIWIGTIGLSAFGYWFTTQYIDSHGLFHTANNHPVDLGDAIYFSFVTITTLGYGDIAPLGLARIIAVFEAMVGVFVVGALISKALSQNQGRVLMETNEFAFDERVARILTNAHFLLIEFQSVGEDLSSHNVAQDQRRMGNAVGTLEHVLLAVSKILRRQQDVNPRTIQTILSAMHNTLEEFEESRMRVAKHVGYKMKDVSTLAEAVDRLCEHELPDSYPVEVRDTARSLHELAISILKPEMNYSN